MKPDAVVGDRQFTGFLAELGAIVRVDYSKLLKDSEEGKVAPDWIVIRRVLKRVRSLGWTPQRFQQVADRFLDRVKFKTWKPADFFGEDAPEPIALHPYAWYQEQVAKNRTAASEIACYETPDGRTGWGWMVELDGILDRHVPETPRVAPSLGECVDTEQQALSDKTALQLEITRLQIALKQRDDALDAANHLQLKAERERDAERKRVAEVEEERDQQRDIATALHHLISQLLDGTLTLDALRMRFEEDATEAA